MRQIVLDTETTGLDPNLGHRVIEIGAVEIINRRPTGNYFHHYLNPEREIDPGAQQVHGITLAFLQDNPRFREIVADLLDYVRGAELIIHNAPFDVGFLNSELGMLQMKPIVQHCLAITDTLKMAKELHPGQRNNLDALCKRYQIDNSGRTLHGALLDAELLAEIYLAMTRGQESLIMEAEEAKPGEAEDTEDRSRPPIFVLEAAEDELAAHQEVLEEIDKASRGACLWRGRAVN